MTSKATFDPWAPLVFDLCQKINRGTGNEASALPADTVQIRAMAARGSPVATALAQHAVGLAGLIVRDLLQVDMTAGAAGDLSPGGQDRVGGRAGPPRGSIRPGGSLRST